MGNGALTITGLNQPEPTISLWFSHHIDGWTQMPNMGIATGTSHNFFLLFMTRMGVAPDKWTLCELICVCTYPMSWTLYHNPDHASMILFQIFVNNHLKFGNRIRRFVIHLTPLLHLFAGIGLSHWKTTLHCNGVSYWLNPYPEWSLVWKWYFSVRNDAF